MRKQKSKRTALTTANILWWREQECARVVRRNQSMPGALRARPQVVKTIVLGNPAEKERSND